MLDKDDLQAIQTMIDTSVTASEERMSAKIEGVEQRMSAKIEDVEQRMSAKIEDVEQRMSAKIEDVEQRMSAKIEGVEQRMSAKIDTASQDTMRGAAVHMEQYFEPKFNILSENVQLILEKLDAMSALEPRVRTLEEELPAVKAVVRANRQDIDRLKDAI